jgi:LysR family transcriptional activator of nhaA
MEWLNYHHLLYFWAVAKEGGLRRASEKLHVSQPSMSAQIRALEGALGEKLFQRKGRGLALTDTGQMVFGYADDIFSLGRDLMDAVKQRPTTRALKLRVGVEDSFPKLLTYQILKPALDANPPMHVVCHEGKAEELLAQLGAHRLDMVLADQPATAGIKFKVFSHFLGSCGVTFCATRPLARALRRGFPKSLHGAPVLLPTQNTTLRRELEEWFQARKIHPRVVAEFEDAALMKVAAANGQGFAPVPSAAVGECKTYFNLEPIGVTKDCQDRFFLLTAERRVAHPGVALLTERARSLVFS